MTEEPDLNEGARSLQYALTSLELCWARILVTSLFFVLRRSEIRVAIEADVTNAFWKF